MRGSLNAVCMSWKGVMKLAVSPDFVSLSLSTPPPPTVVSSTLLSPLVCPILLYPSIALPLSFSCPLYVSLSASLSSFLSFPRVSPSFFTSVSSPLPLSVHSMSLPSDFPLLSPPPCLCVLLQVQHLGQYTQIILSYLNKLICDRLSLLLRTHSPLVG
jgi:hypothetical protein